MEIGIFEQIVEEANNGESKLSRDDIMAKVNSLTDLRNKLMNKIGLKVEIISQSAEGLANQQRMHKFTELCCVEANTNKRIFESASDYATFALNHRDVLSEIYKQAYFTEYGDPSRMSENWAEVKYLKKVLSEKVDGQPVELVEKIEQVKQDQQVREDKAEIAGPAASLTEAHIDVKIDTNEVSKS